MPIIILLAVGMTAALLKAFPLPMMVMIAIAVAFVGATLGYGYYRLRASLPMLQGELRVEGISQPLKIDRDAAGVPIVFGANRMDVAFGLGFLHAQERFFQMDLSRRAAAGELAELFGKSFVGIDRAARIHQFRKRAGQIVASMNDDQRELLTSYTAGVEAGIRALRSPPFEYMLLRSRPVDWRAEDTILVVFHMYYLLQDNRADQDYNMYLLYGALPSAIADFLTPAGSSDWDAPLVGERPPEIKIPEPHILDFRRASPKRDISAAFRASPRVYGSNVWAIAGTNTGTGRAILANDMHLGFGMPPIFYRATLDIAERPNSRRLSGITLPGFPFLIAGSNGDIAWGLANAAIDSVDLVRLDQAGLPPHAYRTRDGVAEIKIEREMIRVRGGADEEFMIQTTQWGPVSRKTREGVQFAQEWIAHHPESVNLEWDKLETATCVAEAMGAANRLGVPTLAIVISDRRGDVGWTLAGPLPHRVASQGKLPAVSSQIQRVWDGWVAPWDYPHLSAPQFVRVWSANAKPIANDEFETLLGHGYYSLGARALQIRNSLVSTEVADEAAMLRIQLDDRALFLSRWRTLLLEVLGDPGIAADPRAIEARPLLENWDGRASAGSAAYRLVRHFRNSVERLVFEPFVSMVKTKHGQFDLNSTTDQLEAPLWRLITDRPMHLLPPWFPSWNDLLVAAVSEILAAIPKNVSLVSHIWGDENALVMRHAMSHFVPLLNHLFDAPSVPLNGDLHMPLAQTSQSGPVFRFVIAPGREDAAILQMAGGQAGNPLAPYYLSGHSEWLEGRTTSLLPGPMHYSLTLLPFTRNASAGRRSPDHRRD